MFELDTNCSKTVFSSLKTLFNKSFFFFFLQVLLKTKIIEVANHESKKYQVKREKQRKMEQAKREKGFKEQVCSGENDCRRVQETSLLALESKNAPFI